MVAAAPRGAGTEFGLQVDSGPRDMKKKITYSVVGLLLGVMGGFKAANYAYRREASASANAAALQAASRLSPAAGVGQGEPGQQVINEVRALIERARSNPQDFEAQRKAAEQFLQIQRPDGAIEFLVRANQIKPDDAETIGDLGEAYFFKQQYAEAITWSRRALKLRPDYPLATFYLMASLVETRQNLDEAERLLARLEQLKPGDRALGQVRENLTAAKSGGGAGPPKTVLSHGPDERGGAKR